jgi:uncharacterized protein YprB with RNaseH-like and TPR domain
MYGDLFDHYITIFFINLISTFNGASFYTPFIH